MQLPFFTAGVPSQVRIVGAQAFEPIEIVFGTRGTGSGPCPASYGGACLDLVGGRTLTTVVADMNGEATWDVTPPTSVAGATVCMQAVVVRGPAGSDTELSTAMCRTIEASCGLSAFTDDLSGYAPGIYDVIRLPHATLTASPRSLVVNTDGSVGVVGGTFDTALSDDETLMLLFDRPVHDLDVGVTSVSSGSIRMQAFGEQNTLLKSVGFSNVRTLRTAGDLIATGEPISSMVLGLSSGMAIQLHDLEGSIDSCPCSETTREVVFYPHGRVELDEIVYPGMAMVSPNNFVVERSRGLGNDSGAAAASTLAGDTYTVSFAPPAHVDDVYFRVGPSDITIEAWDSEGTPLGSTTATTPYRFDPESLYGGVAISGYRVTALSGTTALGSLTRRQCR